jgi:hypothetical protein
MCPVALNPACPMRRAPVVPHVPQFQTSPPCQGGFYCFHVSCGSGPRLPMLRCCHVSYGSRPCLSVGEGSSGASSPMVLDPPPHWRGHRCCHESHCSGPTSPTEEGSDAVTCLMAPDLLSPFRMAPVLPHVSRLQTRSPHLGGLWCCHMSHDSLWDMGLKCKESHYWPKHAFKARALPRCMAVLHLRLAQSR